MSDETNNKGSIAEDILNTDKKVKNLPRFDVDEKGNLLVDGKPTKTTIQLEKKTYKLLVIGTIAAALSAIASIASAIATWKQAEIARSALIQNITDNDKNQNNQTLKSEGVNTSVTPAISPVNDDSTRITSPATVPVKKKKCKNR